MKLMSERVNETRIYFIHCIRDLHQGPDGVRSIVEAFSRLAQCTPAYNAKGNRCQMNPAGNEKCIWHALWDRGWSQNTTLFLYLDLNFDWFARCNETQTAQ